MYYILGVSTSIEIILLGSSAQWLNVTKVAKSMVPEIGSEYKMH